jgi:hypothetical protein
MPIGHVDDPKNLAQSDDPKLRDALGEYHRKRLTNNQEIADLLEREHGIKMRCVLDFALVLLYR